MIFRTVLVTMSLMAMTGCGTLSGIQSSFSPKVRVPPLIPGNSESAEYIRLRSEVLEALGSSTGVKVEAKTITGAIQAVDDAVVQSNRDHVAGLLLSRSNALCNSYLSEITSSQRTWRTTFSVLGLAFGTAGGISSPDSSSQLLSALSGGMSGMSGKLDEGLLSNQAGHLIRAANIQMRRELEGEIISDLSVGGRLHDAPLPLVIAVIESYHSHCGIDDGLTFLNAEIAAKASRD
jgi:hypothetical protein